MPMMSNLQQQQANSSKSNKVRYQHATGIRGYHERVCDPFLSNSEKINFFLIKIIMILILLSLLMQTRNIADHKTVELLTIQVWQLAINRKHNIAVTFQSFCGWNIRGWRLWDGAVACWEFRISMDVTNVKFADSYEIFVTKSAVNLLHWCFLVMHA